MNRYTVSTAATVVWLSLILLSSVAAVHAAATGEASQPGQELNPVIVKGKPDPLAKADRRLSNVRKRLPAGGDGKPAGPVQKVEQYAHDHADPESASGEQRRMMERAQGPAAANGPNSGVETTPLH